MVVYLDFESEDDDPYSLSSPHHAQFIVQHMRKPSGENSNNEFEDDLPGSQILEDTDKNGKLFASALACYPVSLSIAAQLDLNDLYALSFTCRQVHRSLSQFARQLRLQSLHCTNDLPPITSEELVDKIVFEEAVNGITDLGLAEHTAPAYPILFSPDASHLRMSSASTLGHSGKTNKCARDMVAPCRKCGTVVCRNCAAKPPSDRCLPNRFRRLCRTCLDTSVVDHLSSLSDTHEVHDSPPASSASSARSVRTLSSSSSHSESRDTENTERIRAFTSPTFLRQPCSCATRGVYLCQPCGQSLNAADTTYKRVWTWRSRYSTHIGGGLGTGLGLGNQGQKCGRGEYCLERGAAGVCWVEIECSEARAQNHGRDEGYGISRSSTPSGIDLEHDGVTINRPGYLSQELEGIGGVLKKKVKKRVKVGATVYEFDDERASGKYLVRESSGRLRSWCGWCSRVCPGEDDQCDIDRLLNS